MWKLNDFNKWIRKGRQINENVINLDISHSDLKTLGDLKNLVNLEYLNCGYNLLLSLEGIKELVNLKTLYCSNNKLMSLDDNLQNLTNLKELYCYNNQLTSLEGIENLVNLKILFCDNNKLNTLECIEILTKLKKNNKITSNKTQNIIYNTIDSEDSDELIELKKLFDNLCKYQNDDKFYEYTNKIENMIIKLNEFQKYVLK
jgi:Leucine-rich repeat (LRR) protein